MIKCPTCNHPNEADALFCEDCGHPMRTPKPAPLWAPISVIKPRLVLPDGQTEFSLEGMTSVIVGRSDAETGWAAPIDLGRFGGLEKGVSRQHMRLDIDTSTGSARVTDLNSVNGVEINGVEIPIDISYPLQDKDQLRLGNLDLIYLVR